MHDSVATFYGGYDQIGIGRSNPLRISRVGLVVAVAAGVLLILIAADVAAYSSVSATIRVTSVSWYAEGELLTTDPGFSAHASQAVQLSLTCDSICFRVNGASVSAPFSLSTFSVVNQPVQYVNLTVTAPSTGYSGPLTITLHVG